MPTGSGADDGEERGSPSIERSPAQQKAEQDDQVTEENSDEESEEDESSSDDERDGSLLFGGASRSIAWWSGGAKGATPRTAASGTAAAATKHTLFNNRVQLSRAAASKLPAQPVLRPASTRPKLLSPREAESTAARTVQRVDDAGRSGQSEVAASGASPQDPPTTRSPTQAAEAPLMIAAEANKQAKAAPAVAEAAPEDSLNALKAADDAAASDRDAAAEHKVNATDGRNESLHSQVTSPISEDELQTLLRLVELETEKRSENDLFAGLEKKLLDSTTRQEQLIEDLSNRDGAIETLRGELNSCTERFERASAEARTKGKLFDEQRSQLDDHTHRLVTLQHEHDALLSQHEHTRKSLEELRELSGAEKDRVNEVSNRLQQQKAELQVLHSQCEELQTRLENVENERERTERRLSEVQSENEDLQRVVDNFDAVRGDLEARLRDQHSSPPRSGDASEQLAGDESSAAPHNAARGDDVPTPASSSISQHVRLIASLRRELRLARASAMEAWAMKPGMSSSAPPSPASSWTREKVERLCQLQSAAPNAVKASEDIDRVCAQLRTSLGSSGDVDEAFRLAAKRAHGALRDASSAPLGVSREGIQQLCRTLNVVEWPALYVLFLAALDALQNLPDGAGTKRSLARLAKGEDGEKPKSAPSVSSSEGADFERPAGLERPGGQWWAWQPWYVLRRADIGAMSEAERKQLWARVWAMGYRNVALLDEPREVDEAQEKLETRLWSSGFCVARRGAGEAEASNFPLISVDGWHRQLKHVTAAVKRGTDAIVLEPRRWFFSDQPLDWQAEIAAALRLLEALLAPLNASLFVVQSDGQPASSLRSRKEKAAEQAPLSAAGWTLQRGVLWCERRQSELLSAVDKGDVAKLYDDAARASHAPHAVLTVLSPSQLLHTSNESAAQPKSRALVCARRALLSVLMPGVPALAEFDFLSAAAPDEPLAASSGGSHGRERPTLSAKAGTSRLGLTLSDGEQWQALLTSLNALKREGKLEWNPREYISLELSDERVLGLVRGGRSGAKLEDDGLEGRDEAEGLALPTALLMSFADSAVATSLGSAEAMMTLQMPQSLFRVEHVMDAWSSSDRVEFNRGIVDVHLGAGSALLFQLAPLSRQPRDDEADEASVIPAVLEWNGDASNVVVTGSFSQWRAAVRLAPLKGEPQRHVGLITLPEGRYELKFIVDGNWLCSAEMPRSNTSVGASIASNNNVLVLSKGDAKESKIAPLHTHFLRLPRQPMSSWDMCGRVVLRPSVLLWTSFADRVLFAGSFDDWRDRYPMFINDLGGYHWAMLNLRPGAYYVRFCVDGEWMVSEQYPVKSDPRGARSNVLTVPDK